MVTDKGEDGEHHDNDPSTKDCPACRPRLPNIRIYQILSLVQGPTPAFYIHTKIPAALGAPKSVQSLEVFQDH